MSDHVNFRISRATVEDFDDDAELADAVVDPIWPDASVKDELAHIAQGTPGQRAIYALTLFAREVDNGGLRQFLGNSSGLYAQTVVEGLRLLGVEEMLGPLLEGLRVFPEGQVPLDWNTRRKRIYGLSDAESQFLSSIDDRLYEGSGVEERLLPYFGGYIREHPEEFFSD